MKIFSILESLILEKKSKESSVCLLNLQILLEKKNKKTKNKNCWACKMNEKVVNI